MEERFPRSAHPLLLKGLVLLEQGKGAEARQAFEKVLELTPDSLPAIEQLVDLDLAEKQHNAALQRVNRYIEQAPKSPALQVLLARIFLAQKDAPRAEASLGKAVELDPNYRAAHLMLAKLYVSSNKHREALERLDLIVARNPNDLAALMQIGMIHEHNKNFSAASEAYEKILAANREFAPALNNLAYLYSERLGQLDKAYDLARKARDLLPNDPFSADTLGWILYKRGEYAWALNLLQESAEKLPGEPEILFHLAMTHYVMGDEKAAGIAFDRVLQMKKEFAGREEAEQRLSLLKLDLKTAGPEARATLEKQLEQQPDDPVALSRLGAIYERDGAFQKAADIYERVLRQNSKNVAATISLARLNSEHLRNSSRALELAKTARNLAADDPSVSHVLGRVAFREGDHKWALSLLQESARKLTSQPQVLHDLAWACFSMGLLPEAESTMHNALKAGADFPGIDSARQFVEMLALSRDAAKATQSATRIQDTLKTNPDYAPALMAAAAIDQQQNNFAAARQAYEKILARYPHCVVAFKHLAILCGERLGDYQAAYDYAVKAREAFPDDPEVAKALGMVVYRRGDYARSAQLLNESARKRPSDADLLFYLAMAQAKLKEPGESQEALRQALALTSNSQLADEAKRVVAELQ
jgi:tetratricopeptide (TPR) repeat protein